MLSDTFEGLLHSVFRLESFSVGFLPGGLVLGGVSLAGHHGQLSRLDHPAGFAQERGRIHGTGHDVQDPAIGEGEIAGHVASLFLAVDDAKVADFLK